MAVALRQLLVSESKFNIKCPYTMVAEGYCVHNTYNDAPAENEANYTRNNDKKVSFHYVVDDKEVIQCIPENRNAFHAGDGAGGNGNRKYIAVEICYSKSGGEKFTKAEKNAAEFIAKGLKAKGWGIDRVKKHQDFSGKYCPHRTLDLGWERFLNLIRSYMGQSTVPTPQSPKPTPPTSDYNGNSIVDYLESIGQDSSFTNRKKLAEKYGIKNYEGTSAQNLELLNKMRENTSQSGNSSGYTGNSLVDYLKSIGKDSSFVARKKYAAQYGIKNYEGTSEQNTALLNAMRGNSKPSSPKPSVSYYKAVNKNGLVPSLNAIGVDSSFTHRKAIAKANGITNYTGTYSQNDKLATLLANGKLKKA